jgi:hypothetical protein
MEAYSDTCAWGLGELCPLSGAHILHLYLHEVERRHVLLDFIATGRARGERLCLVHDRPIKAFINGLGLAMDLPEPAPQALPCPCPPGSPGPPHADPGSLVTDTSQNFYLSAGVFDHDRIYRKWQEFYRTSQQAGFPACRALGEVLPELEQVANGEALVLYERNLEKVLQANPPTCVICQYDVRCFGGGTLLGILRVHPLVLVENRVKRNPFYLANTDLLSH